MRVEERKQEEKRENLKKRWESMKNEAKRCLPYNNLLQKITILGALMVVGWFHIRDRYASLMSIIVKSQYQFLK